MDIRIVNTCNNNCSYCLEQSLRKKEKFIKKEIIFNLLDKEKDKHFLGFFGGNPLLHPDLIEIIKYAKNIGFKNIGLLTNSFLLEKINLLELKKYGLNTFGIYFNSFDKERHNLIVGENGIKLNKILENILFLKNNDFFVKIIININKQNINILYKDIFILNKKFGVNNFEFINYHPFDRPYGKYKDILKYRFLENRAYIDNLFRVIKKLQLIVNFVKFSKDFFGEYKEFYNFQKGILDQIGEEDLEILNGTDNPFCKKEKRCDSCFLKIKCKWYE